MFSARAIQLGGIGMLDGARMELALHYQVRFGEE
jgi:hypothetical protein